MELEWPQGFSAEPTEALIRELVPTAEYVILSLTELTYIQCAACGEAPPEFELEYQDGSLEQHYRGATGTYDAATCIASMTKYLQGDGSWYTDINVWEFVDIAREHRYRARQRRQGGPRSGRIPRMSGAALKRLRVTLRRQRSEPLEAVPERTLCSPSRGPRLAGPERRPRGIARRPSRSSEANPPHGVFRRILRRIISFCRRFVPWSWRGRSAA